MKKNKLNYTPGPWTWDGDGFLWSKSDLFFEVLYGTAYKKEDRNLIAAAPKMIEALCYWNSGIRKVLQF